MIDAPFRATARTHVGRKRQVNQDWFAIEDIEHANGVYHLLILADGMGGGLKGDVASHTAVEAVLHYFRSARWYNPESAAREAAFSANRAVFDKGTGGGQAPRSFMGTTLVFALVEEVTNRFWLANIGDSRAYLLRQGALEQVTRDHSVVADLEHEGPALSEEEIARLRNVVTRAVGLEPTVAPDIFGPFELEIGDRILLSSDGLHGVVKDDRIQRLASAPDMERALKALIGAANGAGGPDNITVVMGGREAAVASGGTGDRSLRTVVAAASVAVAVVAVAALAVALLQGGDGNEPTDTDPSPDQSTDATQAPSTETPSPTPLAPPTVLASTKKLTLGQGQGCGDLYLAVRTELGLQSAADGSREWFYSEVERLDPTSATCTPPTFLPGDYTVPYGSLKERE